MPWHLAAGIWGTTVVAFLLSTCPDQLCQRKVWFCEVCVENSVTLKGERYAWKEGLCQGSEPSLGTETKVKASDGSFLGAKPSLSSHRGGCGWLAGPSAGRGFADRGAVQGAVRGLPLRSRAELSEVVSPTLQRLPGTCRVSTARAAARPSPSLLFCVWLCREKDLGDGRRGCRGGLHLFY